MTREEAWALVYRHTPSEPLRRHMLCVETAMRWYAVRQGEDPELWGLAGLLHDADYEAFPDQHPLVLIGWMQESGVEECVIRAVASHYAAKTGVQPVSAMERHLVACDELSGFVAAVTFVRPSKSIHEVEVSSVLKKLKQPAFAAGVHREEVRAGAELIGLPLEEHVGNVIEALRGNAQALGLAGSV